MILISEGPTPADRYEAKVSDLRQDHGYRSFCWHAAEHPAAGKSRAVVFQARGPRPPPLATR